MAQSITNLRSQMLRELDLLDTRDALKKYTYYRHFIAFEIVMERLFFSYNTLEWEHLDEIDEMLKDLDYKEVEEDIMLIGNTIDDEETRNIRDKAWEYLSMHSELDWTLCIDYPELPWDFWYLSQNPHIDWEIVDDLLFSHPALVNEWDWSALSQADSLTREFVESNPGLPWKYDEMYFDVEH